MQKVPAYILLPPSNSNGIASKIVKHFYTDLLRPGVIDQDLGIDVAGCIGIHVRSELGIKGRTAFKMIKGPYKFINGIPLMPILKQSRKRLTTLM